MFALAFLCSLDQWSCHETVPPLPGWKDGPGKKVHPQGPWWHAPFYPGRGGSHSPGESWRVNGPEFISRHTEMNTPLFQRIFFLIVSYFVFKWMDMVCNVLTAGWNRAFAKFLLSKKIKLCWLNLCCLFIVHYEIYWTHFIVCWSWFKLLIWVILTTSVFLWGWRLTVKREMCKALLTFLNYFSVSLALKVFLSYFNRSKII